MSAAVKAATGKPAQLDSLMTSCTLIRLLRYRLRKASITAVVALAPFGLMTAATSPKRGIRPVFIAREIRTNSIMSIIVVCGFVLQYKYNNNVLLCKGLISFLEISEQKKIPLFHNRGANDNLSNQYGTNVRRLTAQAVKQYE